MRLVEYCAICVCRWLWCW